MSGEISAGDKLSAAFMRAMTDYPYFASGLMALVRKLVSVPSKTMSVSRGGVLRVDPRFVDVYEVEQIAEGLVHELQHVIRDHAGRSDVVRLVDRLRWNVAADCEINCGLRTHLLPGGCCLPETYGLRDGLLAEEYYDLLPTELGVERTVCSGGCGGGSGGEVVGDEGDADGRSEADLGRIRQEVASAVVAYSSRGRRSVPGDLLRWAEKFLLPPKVRWQDRLGRLLRGQVASVAGKVDYDRRRPGRRQACYGALARSLGGVPPIVPVLRGKVPLVAVGVDTSGSMGEVELARAVSEIDAILRVLGTSVVFLACDSEVQGPPRRVRRVQDLVGHLRGGGGTDFRPVLEEVGRLRPRPHVFVFMTDGQGLAPDVPPAGTDVFWVLVGPHAERPATWGDYVFVKEDT